MSGGHCCATGHEWVDARRACVCLEPSGCEDPGDTVPPEPDAEPSAPPPPARGEACPSGMAPIPAGSFAMGSTTPPAQADEAPITQVTLAAYCMDRTEVTVDAYATCVAAGRCSAPRAGGSCNWNAGRGNHPVNCVDWSQAVSYCRYVGGRLPTEAEWEYAARGSSGRTYPWGESAPSNQLCSRIAGDRDTTCVVGSFPAGRSPFGLDDMAANVWEWTSDRYGPYAGGRVTNPTGSTTGTSHVRRGGGWDTYGANASGWVRTTFRASGGAEVRANVGFRCARDGAP